MRSSRSPFAPFHSLLPSALPSPSFLQSVSIDLLDLFESVSSGAAGALVSALTFASLGSAAALLGRVSAGPAAAAAVSVAFAVSPAVRGLQAVAGVVARWGVRERFAAVAAAAGVVVVLLSGEERARERRGWVDRPTDGGR